MRLLLIIFIFFSFIHLHAQNSLQVYNNNDRKTGCKKCDCVYKKYINILNSDIIHLRRADGRDWDGIMHVNPQLKTKSIDYTVQSIKRKITGTMQLPLYYTGLTNNALISEKDSVAKNFKLSRDYTVILSFSIEPESCTWFVIE